MKTIINYLKEHLKEDFKTSTYFIFFLFIGSLIYVNHRSGFAFNFFYNNYASPYLIGYYFLFFGFAYFSSVFIISITKSDYQFLKLKGFWFTSIFAIVLVSIRFGYNGFMELVNNNIEPEKILFYSKIIARTVRFIVFSVGIVFFYYLFEKSNTNLYGLTTKNKNWKIYFVILLIVVPFIIFASFQPSFLNQYPLIGDTGNSIDKLNALAIYEPIYLFDFITIEWFFRGFLVLGMVKYLDAKCILPMVAMYAFFHLGKPTGEVIASVFGGYVLGVISLHSKSIIGGIIVHVGVAFLMDFTAILQKIETYF